MRASRCTPLKRQSHALAQGCYGHCVTINHCLFFMFAQIKTNGAHTIVIAIPHEGADKTLPALAAMFENNAVFLASPSWRQNEIIKAEMTIHLGKGFEFESKDEVILVQHQDRNAILSEEWQPATPDVFTSNHKAIEKLEQRLKEQADQMQLLKLQLDQANARLQTMQADPSDD